MSGHKIQRHRFDNRRKCEAKSLQCFRLEVFRKIIFQIEHPFFREQAICSWLQIVKWFLMVSVSVYSDGWKIVNLLRGRREGLQFIDYRFFRHFLLLLTIQFREIGWNRIAYVMFNAILRAHKFYFNSVVSDELSETLILQGVPSILLESIVFGGSSSRPFLQTNTKPQI